MQNIYDLQPEFFDDVFCFAQNKKISHAYLIETRNIQNYKDIIDTFVRIIYSSNLDDFNKENLIELHNIDLDGNYIEINCDGSQIKKEKILEIQEKFMTKSLNNNYRIYVINDADKLNAKAGNSLLKFIEEPEENVIGILVTNNRYKVLETIKSRCQILSLANNCNLYQFDNLDFLESFIGLLENYKLKSISLIPSICNYEYYNKEQWSNIFLSMRLIYEMALRKIYNKEVNFDVDGIIDNIVSKNNDVNIIKKIDILSKTIENLEYNLNINLMLDKFVINFVGGDLNA